MKWRIFTGDCREVLSDLPPSSVQCCVTSPPYWGLRDYQLRPQLWGAWLGSLGLEPTPDEYVLHLVEVMRAVRRVLRRDGTLWLNMGDCYATGAGRVGESPGGGEQGVRWAGRGRHNAGNSGKAKYRFTQGMGPMIQPNRLPIPGLKAKDLVGIPWRVAFALQADGWWLRSDIIWSKTNPMPESVTDRPTKSHEYLFLLSKSETYFYDKAAVLEPYTTPEAYRQKKAGARALRGQEAIRPRGNLEAASDPKARYFGNDGRNRRTVWSFPTRPFKGAHFATFPVDLVEPCILAGSRVGDVALDPFAGTGTVGVAAVLHCRRFVGVELNRKYAAMARRRIATAPPLPMTLPGLEVA